MKPQDINLNELELALCIHSGHKKETIAYFQQFLSDKLNRIEKEIKRKAEEGINFNYIENIRQIIRKEFTQ